MQMNTLCRRSILGMFLSVAAMPLAAQDRPVVATDNYPLAYFADRLGGGAVDTVFLVPAGTDPSFWRPGIADISAIQSADVIALNGAGFSTWPTKASLPRSRTIDTSAGFGDRLIRTDTVTHSHGEGGEHSHAATASYTWLDFALAQEQVKVLADAMARQMPDKAASIARERDVLLAELDALDTRAMVLSDQPGAGPVIASHPRYHYFAAAYDLEITALEWDATEDPTDAQWATLETMIADTGARHFIWEAEPSAAAQRRMSALGLTDVVFSPLANTPAEGSFIDRMRGALDALESAFQEN